MRSMPCPVGVPIWDGQSSRGSLPGERGQKFMLTARSDDFAAIPTGLNPGAEAEVVELGLLLQAGVAASLDAAARERGPTIGQMVRSLIRDFLDAPMTRVNVSGSHTSGREVDDDDFCTCDPHRG
jgi:hypothetical protein